MLIAIDEKKSSELKEALDAAGKTLDDFLLEVPEWYTRTSYDEAVLDFGFFKEGATVSLKDCTVGHSEILGRLAREAEADDAKAIKFHAELCKAHIVDVTGDLFPELPKSDKVKEKGGDTEWVNWLKGLKQKVYARLEKGISLFRAEAGIDEGN